MRLHKQKYLYFFAILTLPLIYPATLWSQSSSDHLASNTTRINKGHYSSAQQADGQSQAASMSDNGRFIAFESTATNLIDESLITGGVTDGRRHIYFYDRQAGTVELISITDIESETPNREAPADSFEPAVSNDGRYVAYATSSDIEDMVQVGELHNDLTSRRCSGSACHVHIGVRGRHIYVRDRYANRTMLATQVGTKARWQQIKDGVLQKVDEDSSNNSTVDLRPVMEDVPWEVRMSAAIIPSSNGILSGWKKSQLTTASSSNPRFSADGKYIIFETTANNLVVPNGDECTFDFFYPGGVDIKAFNGNAIVATLTQNFINNLIGNGSINGENFIQNRTDPSTQGDGNGEVVGDQPFYFGRTFFMQQFCYEDSNSVQDAVIRHGETHTNSLMSMFCKFYEPGQDCIPISATRNINDPDVSSDASYVVFSTETPFLESDFNKQEDVYLLERNKIISDNGEKVVEEIANLSRISNNSSKITASNGTSTNPGVSGNGRLIVYQSTATDIVDGDSNGKSDVYLFDRNFGEQVICSKSSSGELGNGDSTEPSISSDGSYVTFQSSSTNFGINNNNSNIYIATAVYDSDGSGRLSDCYVTAVGSNGTGTGGNGASTLSDVGISLITAQQNGSTVRVKRPVLSYQSSSSNVSKDTDTNNVSDIFQSPDCSQTDLTNDADGDGTTDCFDQCWKDATKVEDSDSDGDGIANCEDGCPSDSLKTGPQVCGCGVLETDIDQDKTPDCKDLCPTDPDKVGAGSCGCGVPDVDLDGDGTADCLESNPPVAGATPTTTPTPSGTVSATPTVPTGSAVVPLPVVVRVRPNGNGTKARVVVSSTASVIETGTRFEFQLRKIGERNLSRTQRKTTTKISSTAQTSFSGLEMGSRYGLKYRYTRGSVTSAFSRERIFTVKVRN